MKNRFAKSIAIMSCSLMLVSALAIFGSAEDRLDGWRPVAQSLDRDTDWFQVAPQDCPWRVVLQDSSRADATPMATLQQPVRPNRGWLPVPTAPMMAASSTAKTDS